MRIPLLIGACAAILLGAAEARAADTAAGETYFKKKCAVCHGRKAKGMASFPSLGDRDAGYLADRLETYRARGKVGPNSALMYSHAGKLNDEDIADIAAYLAAAFGRPTSGEDPAEPEEKPEATEQGDAGDEPPAPRIDPEKTGTIACAQEKGQSLGECTYRIARNTADRVTVAAAFANGFERKLFFEDGRFLKADATMSGTGTDTDWRLEDGVHRVRVDDQRYEIPDALVVSLDPAASDEKAVATADPDKGKKHFRKNCRACHGSKAQGVASYPRLSGQPAEYLVKRLEQYRSGEKLGPNTPLMAPRAKKLSDADIADIVAYIGTFR